MLTLLANGSLNSVFTLEELRKQWRVSWHRKKSTYRSEGNFDDLFMHSFVHDAVRPLKDSKILRRLSPGTYQITKIGNKILSTNS